MTGFRGEIPNLSCVANRSRLAARGPPAADAASVERDVPAVATRRGIADMTFGIVVTVLTAVAMVWQQAWPWLRDADGDDVPVLDPDLWDGSGQVLIALLGASLVIQVVVLVRRGWTRDLAIANLVTNASFLGVVAWAALDERLVNTRFLEVLAERGDLDQVPTVSAWVPHRPRRRRRSVGQRRGVPRPSPGAGDGHLSWQSPRPLAPEQMA